MRDVKLGFLLAAPAALTILGVIWFLRKKTSKDKDGENKGKEPSVVKSCKKDNNEMLSQPTRVEDEGITLRQRKIPETGARERGSSDLKGHVMPDTIGGPPKDLCCDIPKASEESPLTNSEKEKIKEIVEAAIGAGLKQAKEEYFEKKNCENDTAVTECMMVSSAAPVQHSGMKIDWAKSQDKSNIAGTEVIEEMLKDEEGSLSTVPTLHSSIQSTISFQTASQCSALNYTNADVLPHPSSAPGEQNKSSSSQLSNTPSENTNLSVTSQLDCSSISPSNKSSTDSAFGECTTSDSNKTDQVDRTLSHTSCSSKLSDSTSSATDVSKARHPSADHQGMKPEESSVNSSSPVCDNNSVGSSDSGRGGSEQDSSSQNTEGLVHYDFNMPSELCGRLIGRQGRNINHIKNQSGASVSLTNNPLTPEFQICQVVGSQAEVDEALAMIRRKFPLVDNPHLTMTLIPLNVPRQIDSGAGAVVVPDNMQMSLPDGASVEVYVSTIVDAGHVFVQQPTHRSFMSLEKLNYFLNSVYSQDESIPSLPTPVECGVICVCENEGSWYRAMIMSPEDEFGECQVKFVDYGGYTQLPISCIKQIRSVCSLVPVGMPRIASTSTSTGKQNRADFMSLPFQAVECFVANVSPLQGEDYFSTDATMALSEMSQLKLLQCQVVARNELGTPYIHLYQVDVDTNTATMVNRALVNQGLVRWVEIL